VSGWGVLVLVLLGVLLVWAVCLIQGDWRRAQANHRAGRSVNAIRDRVEHDHEAEEQEDDTTHEAQAARRAAEASTEVLPVVADDLPTQPLPSPVPRRARRYVQAPARHPVPPELLARVLEGLQQLPDGSPPPPDWPDTDPDTRKSPPA
jgi:hypothetical protein